MKTLLNRLRKDFPQITFSEGDTFYWSPKKQTVTYSPKSSEQSNEVTLLHELAHATLQHQSFSTDFELLQLEVAAWEEAKALAPTYGVSITEDHVQSCLDTYRDWLHVRSTCPRCTCSGMQSKFDKAYVCLNCDKKWRVSTSRLCRPYRKSVSTKKAQTV